MDTKNGSFTQATGEISKFIEENVDKVSLISLCAATGLKPEVRTLIAQGQHKPSSTDLSLISVMDSLPAFFDWMSSQKSNSKISPEILELLNNKETGRSAASRNMFSVAYQQFVGMGVSEFMAIGATGGIPAPMGSNINLLDKERSSSLIAIWTAIPDTAKYIQDDYFLTSRDALFVTIVALGMCRRTAADIFKPLSYICTHRLTDTEFRQELQKWVENRTETSPITVTNVCTLITVFNSSIVKRCTPETYATLIPNYLKFEDESKDPARVIADAVEAAKLSRDDIKSLDFQSVADKLRAAEQTLTDKLKDPACRIPETVISYLVSSFTM